MGIIAPGAEGSHGNTSKVIVSVATAAVSCAWNHSAHDKPMPTGTTGRGSLVARGGQARPVAPDVPGGGPGLLAAVLRTVLLCLVIPAVIWNAQGRGMHDVAAGTAVVRRA